MVDGLLEQAPFGRRLAKPVVHLRTQDVLERHTRQLLARDLEFLDVPEIEHDAAVLRAGAVEHRERFLERGEHRERHELEQDLRAVIGRVLAERRKGFDQPRHLVLEVVEVADLDMARTQRLGSGQEQLLAFVGFLFLLPVEEPVGEEFELHVLDAVVVEDLLHFLEAALLQDLGKVRVPDAHALESGPGERFDAILEVECREFLVAVRYRAAGKRPVRADEFHGQPTTREARTLRPPAASIRVRSTRLPEARLRQSQGRIGLRMCVDRSPCDPLEKTRAPRAKHRAPSMLSACYFVLKRMVANHSRGRL